MGSSSASLSSSHGGPSAQPWQAPTTHIGGTWGEEEDVTNHWTGVPQPSSSLNSVGGGNVGPGGLSGMPGPSGLSALGGGVNSSSINNNWSAGPGLSNGAGSAISSYSLLNSGGIGAGLGANNIGALSGADNNSGNSSGGNSWNGNNNDKSAFESRSKPANWGNFGECKVFC